MPIQKLAKAGAMGLGSELWVVPNPEASAWARKIDWYLNFQIAKAHQHRFPDLAPELIKVLQENEISWMKDFVQNQTLMVATQSRLPAQQVVRIPFLNDKTEWMNRARRVWEDLGRPRLRLFLPSEIGEAEVLQLWPGGGMNTELTFVPGDLSLEA